jgi:hypothetical protein
MTAALDVLGEVSNVMIVIVNKANYDKICVITSPRLLTRRLFARRLLERRLLIDSSMQTETFGRSLSGPLIKKHHETKKKKKT